MCIAYGTSQHRKAIIKGFKTFVVRICKEQYGFVVILALLRYVDDPTLITNQILKPILSKYTELITDKYGTRCILTLLSGLSKKILSPQILALLDTVIIPDPSDTSKLVPSSKKDFETKSKEYEKKTVEALSQMSKNVIKQLTTDKYGWLILYEVIQRLPDKREYFYQIIFEIVTPLKRGKRLRNRDILHNTYGCLLLQKLLKDDSFNSQLYEKIVLYLLDYVKSSPSCFVVDKLLHISSSQEQLLLHLEKIIEECIPFRKDSGVDLLLKSYQQLSGHNLPDTIVSDSKDQQEQEVVINDEDGDGKDGDEDEINDAEEVVNDGDEDEINDAEEVVIDGDEMRKMDK